MKKFTVSLAVLAAAALVAGAAQAQDAEANVTANIGASTDYVFRGVSQTDENPQIFAGADVSVGSVYVGAWASNVDFNDGSTDAEFDVYGGYKPEVAGWTLDIGAIAYLYVNQPANADYDYVEAKLGASRSFGKTSVGLSAYWSPDFFGASEDEATYVQGDLGYNFADKWTVSGSLGRQWVSSDFDYTTWNLGVNWAVTDKVALDVRYYDTDEHDFGPAYDARGVAAVKAVF